MITNRERALFWIITFMLFCVFIHSVRSVLLPFVVGIMVAYFLNPSVDRLEKLHLPRGLVTALIILVFFLVLILIGFFLVPLLYNQTLEFFRKLPDYYEKVRAALPMFAEEYLPFLDSRKLPSFAHISKDSSDYILKFGTTILGSLWLSGMAILNILALLVITPLVAFYLLRDWHIIVLKLNNLLPASYANNIRSQFKEIDKTLSGFMRGQVNVCIIMAVVYATALSLLRLDFGLIIGIACGLLIFIPFVGVLFGAAAAFIIALLQFNTLPPFIMLTLIFLAGQSLEAYFLTPRLVGKKVGLHPVWVIFGMLCGGALLGLTGIILSVPLTAIIGVLTRFFLARYRESDLYKA